MYVQLVPAVSELIVAELIYLQYKDGNKPVYLYINSSGTTRVDGEVVGFETEGMAIYDTMQYVKNDVRICIIDVMAPSLMLGLDLHGRCGHCNWTGMYVALCRCERKTIHAATCIR